MRTTDRLWWSRGLTSTMSKEIADRLDIRPKTVRTHIEHFHVEARSAHADTAVALALSDGELDPEVAR
jgi:DNA-binding NarL/FixJ family response regulator